MRWVSSILRTIHFSCAARPATARSASSSTGGCSSVICAQCQLEDRQYARRHAHQLETAVCDNRTAWAPCKSRAHSVRAGGRLGSQHRGLVYLGSREEGDHMVVQWVCNLVAALAGRLVVVVGRKGGGGYGSAEEEHVTCLHSRPVSSDITPHQA